MALLRRFWIPVSLITLGIIVQVLNWTTDLTNETLIPQFGNSARAVMGRNVALLIAGLLLIWLLFTKQVKRNVKYTIFGIVVAIVGFFAVSIREIENTGNNEYVFHFRWEPTREERLAQFVQSAKPVALTGTLNPNAPRYTDFLGPKRDGVVPGPKLSVQKPKELWRRPVGGGYASCVMAGGLAVTIEQRGEEEMIVAFDLATGHEVWTRGYPGHFKESLGGNGPRACPTIADSEVFALGASGLLVSLDLATGKEKWKTNILQDANATNITWGMCGAPLVTADKVIVNPGGKSSHGVVAYDRTTGKILWHAGNHGAAYATPVLASLHGLEQVVVFDANGVAGHQLTDGKELWRHSFPTFNGINVAQPLIFPDNRVFLSAGYDAGSMLIDVRKTGETWSTAQVWLSKRLKCKMSSAIYYYGYLYGLDDGIFTCINVKNGERQWKAGRYGHGQLLLRNDVLVIMAETGDLVYVAADPKAHRELAKWPMLPGGKTWNAPALAGNLLLLRNHFEAVLLELPTE